MIMQNILLSNICTASQYLKYPQVNMKEGTNIGWKHGLINRLIDCLLLHKSNKKGNA